MIPFSLRPATAEDLPALIEVERRSHLTPWTESQFKAELEKPYSRFLVLTDDDTDTQVAGFIVFWVLHGDCQILNVVVDLPHRGLGHGRRMIQKAIALSMKEGARRAVLDVRKGNLPAIHLYQNLGFAITRVQRNFYSNGEDAYQMSMALEGEAIQF